jgi:hypothetical protein
MAQVEKVHVFWHDKKYKIHMFLAGRRSRTYSIASLTVPIRAAHHRLAVEREGRRPELHRGHDDCRLPAAPVVAAPGE